MSNLPQKTVEAIKRLLMRQQKQVEQNLKSVKEDDPVTAPSLAESSEPGTDSWIAQNHNSIVALGDTLKRAGANIKKALGKIKNGGYGKCENCHQHIENGRLLAMPTAEFCLSCSKKGVKVK